MTRPRPLCTARCIRLAEAFYPSLVRSVASTIFQFRAWQPFHNFRHCGGDRWIRTLRFQRVSSFHAAPIIGCKTASSRLPLHIGRPMSVGLSMPLRQRSVKIRRVCRPKLNIICVALLLYDEPFLTHIQICFSLIITSKNDQTGSLEVIIVSRYCDQAILLYELDGWANFPPASAGGRYFHCLAAVTA